MGQGEQVTPGWHCGQRPEGPASGRWLGRAFHGGREGEEPACWCDTWGTSHRGWRSSRDGPRLVERRETGASRAPERDRERWGEPGPDSQREAEGSHPWEVVRQAGPHGPPRLCVQGDGPPCAPAWRAPVGLSV